MSLVVCGVNYQTAPLAIREQLAFTPEQVIQPLQQLVTNGFAREAVILSTCNRTELYCLTSHFTQAVQWLTDQTQVQLESHLYVYEKYRAVQHIMRVASGLNSMVLGEPQILGQLKQAVNLANRAGTLGTNLDRLFQHVFAVTKQVRSNTAIGKNPVSVAYAAVSLAKRIFAEMNQVSVLLIGAGETIGLVAKHLKESQAKRLIIANRNIVNAERLARQFKAEAISIAEIPQYLPIADIIITATASSLPILGKGSIETALKARKHRPMLMFDLAVPRDIESEVAELRDVYLYTVDDLKNIIHDNLENRQKAAEQAEKIIDFQAEHYIRTLRSLDSVPIICAFRDKITVQVQDELVKAIKKLQAGAEAQQVIHNFAYQLTNKLLHRPTIQLRQAAYNEQTELLNLARQLFDLKE